MGNGVTQCEWRHAPEARRGFWEILNKSELRWDLPREKTVGFCLLPETFVAAATRVGGRWKRQNWKIEPLSTYVEEPLNSKVIKCFVPEQRSRYVFFEFRDSCSMYICMNIPCTFRIAISGYGIYIYIYRTFNNIYIYIYILLNILYICIFIYIGCSINTVKQLNKYGKFCNGVGNSKKILYWTYSKEILTDVFLHE